MRHQSESSNPVVAADLLRVSDRELHDVLKKLDEQDGRGKSAPAPSKGDRIRYDKLRRVSVELDLLGRASVQSFLMKPRDLTTREIRVIHGAFVHPKTHAVVTLLSLANERIQIQGVIRDCSHVSGRLHQLVIQFTEAINPGEFIDPEAAKAAA